MKQTKYNSLYYIALVYLLFAFLEGARFPFFYLTFPTLLFMIAYILLIHIKLTHQRLIAFLWCYLVGYILCVSCFFSSSMSWYLFYVSNLLSWRFTDRLTSYRSLTFLGLAAIIFIKTTFFEPVLELKVMGIVAVTFVLVFWLATLNMRKESALKEELYRKNEYINLLAAENERNRIGRDLHDTLGHMFAMLSLKSELALKQIEHENFDAVRQQLEDIRENSQKAMSDVRKLVNDLSYRTIDEEIKTILSMFDLSGITMTVSNDLSGELLDPKFESAIAMIIRELSTNIIKHSQASHCQLHIKKSDGYKIEMIDDGCGFDDLSGKELHSIKERLTILNGEVMILSKQNPTHVCVEIDERIF